MVSGAAAVAKMAAQIVLLLAVVFCGVGAAAAETINPNAVIVADDAAPCVRHGAEHLAAVMSQLYGRKAAVSSKIDPADGMPAVIMTAESPVPGAGIAGDIGIVPQKAESYGIFIVDGAVIGLGRDDTGAMYAAYDIAEQLNLYGKVTEKIESPANAIRAINPFFHVEALEDDNSWFYDENYWKSYLDTLSLARFNLLDIHAMFDLRTTFFPNAYLYLTKPAKYPAVGVPADRARKNMEMFQHIVQLASARGIRVSLMSYHASWRKTDRDPQDIEPDEATLTNYTNAAVTEILQKVPDLYMTGFRIGESGMRGDFYKGAYVDAIKKSGKDIRLYTRTWLTSTESVRSLAASFPGRTYIEIKYNGEHLGLPYHAMTQPREGFTDSYSYEDYTGWPRDYRIIWQVRANGTHRVFRWGDPEFVRRTIGTFQFGSADGFTLEPMISYYPVTDSVFRKDFARNAFRWDHDRNWYWYMLWGRLSYDPATPQEVWMSEFRHRFGEKSAKSVFDAVNTMSKIVPLIYSWRCLGPDHRQMAPELEPGGSIIDFADNTPLDPLTMYGISDFAADYITNAPALKAKLSPLEAASMLDGYAMKTADSITAAKEGIDPANREFATLAAESEMLAALARYYAAKIRAATFFEFYKLTGTYPELVWAEKYTRDAVDEWLSLAATGESIFNPVPDILRMKPQTGKPTYQWSDMTSTIMKDVEIVEAEINRFDDRQKECRELAVKHLPNYNPRAGYSLRIAATVQCGGDSATATLHYRRAGETTFNSVKMEREDTTPSFSALISSGFSHGQVEYYIEASSDGRTARYPRGNAPGVSGASRKDYSIDDYMNGTARKDRRINATVKEMEKSSFVLLRYAEEGAAPIIEAPENIVFEKGEKINVKVRARDGSGISNMTIFYKKMPSTDKWRSKEMVSNGDQYSAVLPLDASGLLYFFQASDIYGNAASAPDFRTQTPYYVIDSWDPQINPYAER